MHAEMLQRIIAQEAQLLQRYRALAVITRPLQSYGIIEIVAERKPVYRGNFLLANNNNLRHISHGFHGGYLFITHSFSVISANITINNIFSKTKFFELHFSDRIEWV